MSLDRVSETGNTIIRWRGIDPWRDTDEADLQYAWRLDQGEWSVFATDSEKVFFSLDSGDHLFEVKARDQDYNEDPTPSVAAHIRICRFSRNLELQSSR